MKKKVPPPRKEIDFSIVSDKISSGDWRVERVNGNTYTLLYASDEQRSEKIGEVHLNGDPIGAQVTFNFGLLLNVGDLDDIAILLRELNKQMEA